MRDDQRIRGLGIFAVVVAYVVRTWLVGNGVITVFSYEADPFGLMGILVLMLALPETIEMLPFGPTRG